MGMHNINVNTLKQWLENNEAILVDVREPPEFAAVHIAGATLVPLATVSTTTLPQAHNKKLVIYCRSGKRSVTACEALLQQNPALTLYNLEGGVLAWQALMDK